MALLIEIGIIRKRSRHDAKRLGASVPKTPSTSPGVSSHVSLALDHPLRLLPKTGTRRQWRRRRGGDDDGDDEVTTRATSMTTKTMGMTRRGQHAGGRGPASERWTHAEVCIYIFVYLFTFPLHLLIISCDSSSGSSSTSSSATSSRAVGRCVDAEAG